MKFFIVNLLVSSLIAGYMIYSPPALSDVGLYVFNTVVVVNALFFPFARIYFRTRALGYSNGNEWKYSNAIVRGNVDFLSIILSFLTAIPVGIPYAIYMLVARKKGS